ncbi:MAG: SUMF1/EgtB/PvdO family nonheme iron enzyme [Acidobacteria bacterium]|nr:SUMF1/EgtB/PvdO family nonheme iron enzyme [Acidobacteriota bacterium]
MKEKNDPNKMNCREIAALLPWCANNTATPEERVSVERHMDVCGACRRKSERWQSLAAMFNPSFPVEPVAAEPSPSFWGRLKGKVAAIMLPPWDQPFNGRRQPAWQSLVQVALLILFLAATSLAAYQRHQAQEQAKAHKNEVDRLNATIAEQKKLLDAKKEEPKIDPTPLPTPITLASLPARPVVNNTPPSEPAPSPALPGLAILRLETVRTDKNGRERPIPITISYFLQKVGNAESLTMVYIPRPDEGKTIIGSPANEHKRDNAQQDETQHWISIQKHFFMSQTEITQALWRLVASLPKVSIDLTPSPSKFSGENLPVESIRWEEAVEFCNRLSRATSKTYRLPTEAEWEYASRGNAITPFSYGETITPSLASYNWSHPYYDDGLMKRRGPKTTSVVGSFPANPYGLYDMHGNVGEFCLDNYVLRNSVEVLHAVRGGAFNTTAAECRSADRGWLKQKGGFKGKDHREDVGFRVVCSDCWDLPQAR